MYLFSFSVDLDLFNFTQTSSGPPREKTCLRGFSNNTGADQPAHPRSLISAFVIRFVVSITSKIATSEISIFYLVIKEALNLVIKEALNLSIFKYAYTMS